MKRAAEGPAELRPSKWTRIDQGDGKPSYFVNDETNETTWTLPQGSHAKPPKAKTVIAPQAVDIYQQALQQQNMLRVQAEAAQRQALVRQGAVVDVWKCVPQVGPGKPPYYVNSKTGERAWSVPSGAQVVPWSAAPVVGGVTPVGARAAAGGGPAVAHHNQLYRTQLCATFMASGQCRYGEDCKFAHGEEQLRQRHDPLPQQARVVAPRVRAAMAAIAAERAAMALARTASGGGGSSAAPVPIPAISTIATVAASEAEQGAAAAAAAVAAVAAAAAPATDVDRAASDVVDESATGDAMEVTAKEEPTVGAVEVATATATVDADADADAEAEAEAEADDSTLEGMKVTLTPP